jgi:lysophospholipase L1-like esterase
MPDRTFNKILAPLALVAASTIIALLFMEAATRLIFRNRLDYQIEMSRYASTIKRPARDTRMSHEHIPNTEARLMGVPVAINSLGFRNREITVAKPPNVIRILLVGDSLTLGWGVRAEDTFAERLEARLNDELHRSGAGLSAQVVNTGIGNYNTAQELALFENSGRQLAPDLVLLNYFINDAEPTPVGRTPYIVSYSYLAMLLWGRLDSLRRMETAGDDYRTYYSRLYADRADGFMAMRRALSGFGELSKADGFQFVVALLPELHSVSPNYEFAAIHEKVRALALQSGASTVADLAGAFAGEQPRALWVSPDDAHPNARGHEIIANALTDHLVAHGHLGTLVARYEGGRYEAISRPK